MSTTGTRDENVRLWLRLMAHILHGWGLRHFTVNGSSGWISTPPSVSSPLQEDDT